MSKNSEHVREWRARTKNRIVKAFGGKCGCCHYDKCSNALDLHHINPEEKEFSFSKIRANPVSWTKLVAELRKCVLVCANCHREIHAGVRRLPSDCVRFNEDFADYRMLETLDAESNLLSSCPVCKTAKLTWNKTCSYKCAVRLKGTINWSEWDEELKIMFERGMSHRAIGRVVGCSGVAIAKRLRKLNLIV